MLGVDKISIAYRGKPGKYSSSQATIFKGNSHEGINDIGKILVNGAGVYFSLLNKKPTLFNMSMSQIGLTCPIDSTNQNFGIYTIQVNTTTSTCPRKKSLLTSTLDVRGTLEKGCLLQKNLIIDYQGVRSQKPTGTSQSSGTTSSTSSSISDKEKESQQRIMYWFYAAIGIFLIVVAGGLIFMYMKRKATKVKPTANVEVVQVTEQTEKGEFNIRRITNTDTDISPAHFNTQGTDRVFAEVNSHVDPETPLRKKPNNRVSSPKKQGR